MAWHELHIEVAGREFVYKLPDYYLTEHAEAEAQFCANAHDSTVWLMFCGPHGMESKAFEPVPMGDPDEYDDEEEVT